MKITIEMNDFYELYEICWSGAIDTLKVIMVNDKENQLMDLLEELFFEGATMTQINDFLWFENDYIFECLNINLED